MKTGLPAWWSQPLKRVTDLHRQLAFREVWGARDVVEISLRFRVALLASGEWPHPENRFKAREIARKCSISSDDVEDLFHGRRLPAGDAMARIVAFLGVPERWLYSGDPKPHSLCVLYDEALSVNKDEYAKNPISPEWQRAIEANILSTMKLPIDCEVAVTLTFGELSMLMQKVMIPVPVNEADRKLVIMAPQAGFEAIYSKISRAMQAAREPPKPPRARKKRKTKG